MQKQKHLLIVRSAYPAKEFVLKRLRELGYYIIILDDIKTCPDELVDEWIFANTANAARSIEAIRDYLAIDGNYIDGALTFWEYSVLTTSKIIDAFNFTGIPYAIADKLRNKLTFRDMCRENNLPTPKFHSLRSIDEISEIADILTFPVVVKPIYGAASTFVVKANSPEELKERYLIIEEQITKLPKTKEWKSLELYVEEYIDGQEVDIDILIQDGTCLFASVTDNFQTHEPYFIETGQALPSSLPQSEQNKLIRMALTVLQTAGVTNGCIHFEAKSSSQGPVPVEVNLRMGGDHVYNYIKDGWGVDLIEGAARIACNEPILIEKPQTPLLYLEGKYFEPTKAGILKNIIYPESFDTNPHIVDLHFSMKNGDMVIIPPEGFVFFGWITTSGKSRQEAQQLLEEYMHQVTFEVK